MSAPTRSVIIPFTPQSAAEAGRLALALAASPGCEVILSGHGPLDVVPQAQVRVLGRSEGKGRAVRNALDVVRSPVTLLHEPHPAWPASIHEQLVAPLLAGRADAAFASRPAEVSGWAERTLGALVRLQSGSVLRDPLTGLRGVRTDVLRELKLQSEGEEVDAELVARLAGAGARLVEVPLPSSPVSERPLREQVRRARAILSSLQAESTGIHEGHATLERMNTAYNYNAWLGQRFREHIGRRVLEVGAGIGTITRELAPACELLIALEVEAYYVERLGRLFADTPHVRPYLSDVALADWRSLEAERLDSVVLSNVLEHIPDDAQAVRRFREVLEPGGRLVVLVPALPALFGALDEAVGHHRRYTPATLRAVLEQAGLEVERLEWMNLLGMPGWFVNGRLLKKRSLPPLQLRLYDQVAPLLARAESHVRLPVGMSLFAVARTRAA